MSLRRGSVISLAVIAILLGALIALWESLYPPEPPEQLLPPGPAPETVSKQEVPEQPVARERRPLAIEGRVFSGEHPLAGATVRCGDESAVTAADGLFLFPPAVRPRRLGARIVVAGKDVSSWEGLVAGDAGPGGADPDSAIGDDLFPSRPDRLRWTLCLPSAAGDRPREEWIRVEEAAAEEWGSGARVRVRGHSSLPDGAHISASLYFDGFRFIADMEPAEVASATFTASLYCPPDVRFYSGTYEVRASFSSVLELPATKAAWAAARPSEDWEALVVPEEVLSIFIGNPAEARSEDLEVGTYYTKAAGSARMLRQVLRSRVRALRLLAKAGSDLQSWKEKAPARDGWTHEDLVTPDGKFDVSKWRQFLDVEWRPRVIALRDAHAARGQEKYQEAGRLLAAVLGAILEESYTTSRFQIYSDFRLEPDDKDFYPDEENAGDLIQIQRIIEGGFEALGRYERLDD